MLSPRQEFMIESMPAEGGCFYLHQGKEIAYDPQKAEEIALNRVRDKIKPDQKDAKQLHGPAGSGKTYTGFERLYTDYIDTMPYTAIISYDEDGAIYDIPEYVEALRKILPEFVDPQTPLSPERARETMEARRQLWLDFQPLSQHIRSLTLKEALRRELSLFIDTTSSSPGALKMIETLRQLDYNHIEVWSTLGPLDVAKNRIEQRARPTSNNDYLVKRIGAYEMLPPLLAGEVDRFVLTLNDSNNQTPEDILVLEAGRPVDMNLKELNKLRKRLAQESGEFAQLATELLPQKPELPARYDAVVANLDAHLSQYAGTIKQAPRSVLTLRRDLV